METLFAIFCAVLFLWAVRKIAWSIEKTQDPYTYEKD